MHTVCHIIKSLEKLAVDHTYQIIQRGVRIRNTAEKGNFSFAHAGKIQFIGIGQLGDLRQVEGCQTDTNTDQDGLGGLSCRLLVNVVLLDGNAVRVPHLQTVKQNVQRGLVVLILFFYLCRA
ncbi:Uncharacterised protein [Agathobacter rectalis]|uniref:Uncharacterized protein n=1 Tax=Agathobacter rectalis TaxID=39491 RepID=A0A173VBK7_9FIRM|nr:Uncharacterised protein [Agathobacter rectalis]